MRTQRKEYQRNYLATHRKERLAYFKKHIPSWRKKVKQEAFVIIANSKNIACVRCGINDSSLLEINHKNNDGGEERKKNNGIAGYNLCINILKQRRETSDLEILCKKCHRLYHRIKVLSAKWNYPSK